MILYSHANKSHFLNKGLHLASFWKWEKWPMLFLVCNHVTRRPCCLTRQQTFYKNTITLFVLVLFSISLGTYNRPKRNSLQKCWEGQQRLLWYFWKKADTFFPAEFTYKRVKFPAKRNAYVPVNHHGRRDVICKPTVPKKSKTIDIITLFNLVTLMPRITGFYHTKHFHSSLCTFFSTSGSRRLRYYRSA